MCSRVLADTKVWGCPVSNDISASGEGSPSASPSSSNDLQPLKMLELSNSMHPQYISFQVLLALNSSSYNGISCHGLNMNLLQDKDVNESNENANSSEEAPTSYLKHLKILIHSRNWLRLEFHRCLGVQNLIWEQKPKEALKDTEGSEDSSDVATAIDEMSKFANTTEVELLVLKFRKSSSRTASFDENFHRDFFSNLWNHWKVRKLSLSMDFTPEWTKEFCRRKVSVLEELQINPECTWHSRQATPVGETPTSEISGSNGHDDIDCWKLFCRELRINHPRLKSLEISCKIQDDELAYLIDHAIAPADVVNAPADPQTTPSSSTTLPIENIYFGKWCSCDEKSLLALSRVMRSSAGVQQWKALKMYRGTKLPSRNALDYGLRVQPQLGPDRSWGLLEFCRALRHASGLTQMELGDYILDEKTLGALFESLVLASCPIERLWLFACATTSPDVYEKVLCGGGTNLESPSPFSPYLLQNRLPSLSGLFLPGEASKALFEVLKSNTSIEITTNHGRTKTHEYYLDLNRGGRRIYTALADKNDAGPFGDSPCHRDASPSSFKAALSPTLWPKVLERASSDLTVLGLRKDRYCGGKNRKYDVVYNLLRNRILLEM